MIPAPSRRILRSWLALCAGRGGATVLAAALLAVAGRALGAAELGVLLLHLATFGVTSLVASAGIMPVLLREMAGSGAAPFRAALRRARTRAALAGLVFAGAVTLFGHAGDLWLLACAALHLTLPLQLAAAPSLLEGRTSELARSDVAGRAAALVIVCVCAVAGADTAGCYLLAHTLGHAVAGWLLWRRLPDELRGPARPSPWRHHRADTVAGAGDLVRAGYFHGGQWLVAAFAGATYASLGGPLRLLALVTLLPSSLATTIMGPLSSGPRDERRLGVLRAVPAVLGAGLLCALLLALPASSWLRLVYPELADPALAADCLRVLALSVPALFGAGLCLPFLLASGRERHVLAISAVGLLVMHGGFLLVTGGGVLAGAACLTACEWTVFGLALWRVVALAPLPEGAHA